MAMGWQGNDPSRMGEEVGGGESQWLSYCCGEPMKIYVVLEFNCCLPL